MLVLFLWLSVALGGLLTADEAVERALDRSVQVASASARVEQTRGRVRTTRALRHDPTVRGRWAAVGDVHGITVRQPVSLSGEGLADHRAALAEAQAARASERRTRLEVAAATRLVWTHAVEARERVRLTREALTLATRLREAAEARHRTGDGSLLDVRLARLQETEVRTAWMVAVAAEGDCLVELARWTGVDAQALELPDDPLLGMPEPAAASSSRSDLQAAQARLTAARAHVARERAGVLPPVQLGAFYEQEGDELRVGPTVGLTVPLWSRNADARTQARAQERVAASQVSERERAARAEQAILGGVQARLEPPAQGPDPRVEAEAALASIAAGYQRGELDLLTASLLRQEVLEGQFAWLEARRIRSRARILSALAHESQGLLGGP